MSGKTKRTAVAGVVLCLCGVVCLTITDRALKVGSGSEPATDESCERT